MGTEDMLIEMISGRGNLDARALWAALVGRYRLAHGEKLSLILTQNEPVLIAKNLAKADVFLFVGVSLPAGAATDPVLALFSSQSQLGFNASIPVRLTSTMGQQDAGGPAVGGGAYLAVMQPGEELHAQLPMGGPVNANIVVTKVAF